MEIVHTLIICMGTIYCNQIEKYIYPTRTECFEALKTIQEHSKNSKGVIYAVCEPQKGVK